MERVNEKSVFQQFWLNTKRTFSLGWSSDRKLFLAELFLLALTATLPLAISYASRYLLDAIIDAQKTLQIISIAIISIFVFRYLVEMVSDFLNSLTDEYVEKIFRQKFENKMSLVFSKKLMEIDIPHFENPETQNLIMKGASAYPWRLNNFIYNSFGTISIAIGFILSFLALIPFGIWIPLVMTLATVPRFIIRNRYIKIEWERYSENSEINKESRYLQGLLGEYSNVKEIKVAQSGNRLLTKLDKLQNKVLESIKQPSRKYLPKFYFSILIEVTVLALLGYFKLPQVVSGVLSIGSFTFFIQMLDRISSSAQGSAGSISRAYEQSLYVGYFFDVLELPKIIYEKDPGYEFDDIKSPRIEFRNVSFSYESTRPVLKNISFVLEPGEHLAIVGPNGAGKSTLIRLLLRFYDPTSGEILINGIDLRDLKLNQWYKFVSILFQDYIRFGFSVKENITINKPNPNDDSKMIESARKSGADVFIRQLPNKYEQRLGRRFKDSTELSQGQWQKLALARVFYEDAPILILDEPTSSIDADSEAEIFKNLDNSYKNKTLILISHRFSTVRNADKILVIKNGRIVENGNHKKLMSKSGIYASMFKKQAKGYEE